MYNFIAPDLLETQSKLTSCSINGNITWQFHTAKCHREEDRSGASVVLCLVCRLVHLIARAFCSNIWPTYNHTYYSTNNGHIVVKCHYYDKFFCIVAAAAAAAICVCYFLFVDILGAVSDSFISFYIMRVRVHLVRAVWTLYMRCL